MCMCVNVYVCACGCMFRRVGVYKFGHVGMCICGHLG